MTHHHTERMDESNIVLLREDAPDLIAIVEESIPGGAVIAYAYDKGIADTIVSALNQQTNEVRIELTDMRGHVVRGDSYGMNRHGVTVWDNDVVDSGCAYSWSVIAYINIYGPSVEQATES